MRVRTLGFVAGLMLFGSPAFAASHMYIREFASIGQSSTTGTPAQIAQEPAILDQTVLDFSGGVQVSSAFNASTTYIMIECTTTCSFLVSATGTHATTSNMPLAAGTPYFTAVPAGYFVSVIANSDF